MHTPSFSECCKFWWIKTRVVLVRRILNMLWMPFNIICNKYRQIKWISDQKYLGIQPNHFPSKLRSDDAFSRLFQFFLLFLFSFFISCFSEIWYYFHSTVGSFVFAFVSILPSFLWLFFHHDGTRKTKKKTALAWQHTHNPSPYEKGIVFSLLRIGSSNTLHGTYIQFLNENNYDNKFTYFNREASNVIHLLGATHEH